MAFRRRLRQLFLLTCIALGVIWLRIVQLQTVEGAAWEAAARAKRERVVELPAPRGRIVDRHGRVLARDRPVFQLAVVGWECERRHRARCRACGAIRFRHRDRLDRFLRPCPCGASPAAIERLPPGDWSDLDGLVDPERGGLESCAEERIREVERLVAELEERLESEQKAPFLVHDAVAQRSRDLLHRPSVVASRLDPETVRRIELDEEGRYRGLRVLTVLRREYPEGGPAGQLLGYVSVVRDHEELEALRALYGRNVTLDTRVGRKALERGLEALLLGKTGWARLARDEDGAFTAVVEEQPPVRGREIRLALSTEACRRAEEALSDWGDDEGYFPKARPSGAFVALYADDGSIAAWGEMPRMDVEEDLERAFDDTDTTAVYDPDAGHWVPGKGRTLPDGLTLEEWRRLLSKPAPLALSRVSEIAVEPGSTFKVFIGLGLLEGLRHMAPGTHLPFGGHFSCRDRTTKPRCHGHRAVTFEGALEVSCNRYFALSLRDFPAHFAVYRRSIPALLQRMGFGEHTGTDVWGEETGIFLHDYVDFDPRAAAHAALQSVTRRRRAAAGQMQLRVGHGVPPQVAGRGAERLQALLDTVLDASLDVERTIRLVLSIEGTTDAHRAVDLTFRVHGRYRPGGPPPKPIDWKALRRALRRMGARLEGGETEDGGIAFAFRLRYHERIGRVKGDPLMILPDEGRNFAIGQGPIAATPLQMARAVAVIANGGTLVTPHAAVMAGHEPIPTSTTPLDIAPADLERVREGMRAVVEGPEGTASRADWHTVPATVYGKTGTAQVGAGWRMKLDGTNGPWHQWFVGFTEAPGMRTIAFACVLHSRTESAASRTAVHAACDFLRWWYREGPDAR